MKAVTVHELMLMKERRDALEEQRDDLLKALREIIEYTAPLMQAKDVLGFDINRIARSAIERIT